MDLVRMILGGGLFSSPFFFTHLNYLSMTVETRLLKVRYARPLLTLYEDGFIKGLISVIAGIMAQITGTISVLSDMFRTPAELVLLLTVAIIIDWVTGIMYAKRTGQSISSIGLRQTWVKITEYAFILILLSGIANVFGGNTIGGWVGASLEFMKNIHWMGYFYVIFTEFKSIAGNLENRNTGIAELIAYVESVIFGNDDDSDDSDDSVKQED